jgi:uncharacterized MAPEG superfamily protein
VHLAELVGRAGQGAVRTRYGGRLRESIALVVSSHGNTQRSDSAQNGPHTAPAFFRVTVLAAKRWPGRPVQIEDFVACNWIAGMACIS